MLEPKPHGVIAVNPLRSSSRKRPDQSIGSRAAVISHTVGGKFMTAANDRPPPDPAVIMNGTFGSRWGGRSPVP